MSRTYSQADQEFALERLIANRGDVTQTAKELGISTRTLYRWRDMAKMSPLPLTTLTPSSPSSPQTNSAPLHSLASHTSDNLPADDLQALLDLKAEMVRAAKYIAVNIIAAVEAAPLGQRVTALAQLIDRIAKLAAQLPAAEEEEILVYEGENVDEDENPAEEASQETSGNFEE